MVSLGSFCSSAQRVLLVVVGGYFLSAALASCYSLLLSWMMPRSEAVALMSMMSYIVYLIVLVWGFSEPHLWRLWLVLVGGLLIVFCLITILASIKPAVG